MSCGCASGDCGCGGGCGKCGSNEPADPPRPGKRAGALVSRNGRVGRDHSGRGTPPANAGFTPPSTEKVVRDRGIVRPPTARRSRVVPRATELLPATEPRTLRCGQSSPKLGERLRTRGKDHQPRPKARGELLLPGFVIPLDGALRPVGRWVQWERTSFGGVVLRETAGGLRRPTRPGMLSRAAEVVGPPPARQVHKVVGESLPSKAPARALTVRRPFDDDDRIGARRGVRPPQEAEPGVQTASFAPAGVACAADYYISYRTVNLTIECEFYTEYLQDKQILKAFLIAGTEETPKELSYGLVSSAGAALEGLWGEDFLEDLAEQKVDRTKPNIFGQFHDRLGCYAIPQGGNPNKFLEQYAFFPYDWGAPHKFYLWMCAFVWTYASKAQYRPVTSAAYTPSTADEIDDTVGTYSDGSQVYPFDEFVMRQLEGRSPWSRNQDWRCSLQINIRTVLPLVDRDDSYYVGGDRLNDWEPCSDGNDGEESDCRQDLHDGECYNLSWDDWTLSKKTSGNCWGTAESNGCDPREISCGFNAYERDGTVNFHASDIAFDGTVFDIILDEARTAYDYSLWLTGLGRDLDALVASTAAWRLGRYALSLLMYRGAHFLHEIGHSYFATSPDTWNWPGVHCEYSCGNDIAPHYFVCGLRAKLGIPEGWYESSDPTITDEFHPRVNTDILELNDSCSGDDWAVTNHSCGITENGTPGSDWSFCSTGCLLWLCKDAGCSSTSPFLYAYWLPDAATSSFDEQTYLHSAAEADDWQVCGSPW